MAADPGSQQLTWPNEPRCGGGPSGLFVGGLTRKYVISFWLLNKINSNKPECDGCPESADASARSWQVFRKHWNQILQHNNSSQFSSWWGPSYCVGWHLDCPVLCKNANKEKKASNVFVLCLHWNQQLWFNREQWNTPGTCKLQHSFVSTDFS